MLKALLRIFREPPPTDFYSLKTRCNGAQDGFQCQHYWPTGHLSGHYQGKLSDGSVVDIDDNPEFRRARRCTLVSPPVDLGEHVKAYCARYLASDRPFDADFEKSAPKELDLPAMIAGGGIPTVGDMIHLGGPTENSTVKDWDAMAGAPLRTDVAGRQVVDDEATAVVQAVADADAAANGHEAAKVQPEMKTEAVRGFVHAEVASLKTACSLKAPGRALAKLKNDAVSTLRALVDPKDNRQFDEALTQVTCPGCLALIAERPDVRTIIRERMEQVAEYEISQAQKKLAEPNNGEPNGQEQP